MKPVRNEGIEVVCRFDFCFTMNNEVVTFQENVVRKMPKGPILNELLKRGHIMYANEAPPPPPPPEPEPEVEEEDPLVAALESLIEEGDPENFKKDGTPKSAVVNKLAGRAVTTEEREAAWQTALNR